jgi:hypothetical protein
MDKEIRILHCKRCGEDWVTRQEGRPICCGVCKSTYWDKEYKSPATKAYGMKVRTQGRIIIR